MKEPDGTTLTVEVLEGDQWMPVTDATVSSGDSVRVNLTYTIPPGIVHENSRIIHYQLPAGIGLSEASTGSVMNGETQVGTYTISEDGLITIAFNTDFAQGGETFTGTGSTQPFPEQLASGGTRSRLCGRPVFEGDERFGKETVKSTYRPASKPLVLLQNTAVFLMPCVHSRPSCQRAAKFMEKEEARLWQEQKS